MTYDVKVINLLTDYWRTKKNSSTLHSNNEDEIIEEKS